jgi:hypothetical protein
VTLEPWEKSHSYRYRNLGNVMQLLMLVVELVAELAVPVVQVLVVVLVAGTRVAVAVVGQVRPSCAKTNLRCYSS